MRVSIIIPFYNREQTLAWTIRSAREQTYKNFEIILVDDGSNDTSAHVAQEAAAVRFTQSGSENVLEGWHDASEDSDSRVKVIMKKNGGLVSALNLAVTAKTILPSRKKWKDRLAHVMCMSPEMTETHDKRWCPVCHHDPKYPESPICTGDAILVLASDDWIEPTFLEKTVWLMDREIGIVSTDMHVFSETSDSIVQPQATTYTKLLMSNTIPATSLFRREALDKVGGFKDNVYEDWLLWLDVLRAGWGHAVVHQPLFHYRHARESLTTLYTNRHEELIRNMRVRHPRTGVQQ
jgi:glycogen synthase